MKSFIVVLIFSFVSSSLYIPQGYADESNLPSLPQPGVRVHLSPEFTPALLKGIVIHPENAFKFDFIVYKGDKAFTGNQKKEEYTKLIKYFLASLAVPDEDQWVNLSPYEHNRIIKDDFGKTEMGRDLLAQDYLLKQITASLIYPQDKLGRKFWDEIYANAYKQFGTTNIPVNTFNKVWIIPDDADIYEKGNTAYLYKSHLKVMLEEDYLSLQKHSAVSANTHALGSKIVRQIILPQLEKEVNEGKNFAPLRQVFSGMILAAWYKRALRESLLAKIYANKDKVKGIDQNPKNNEVIYQQYLKAYKKGVFNYIKEDVDKYTNETIPRKYFSGGTTLIPEDAAMGADGLKEAKFLHKNLPNSAMETTKDLRSGQNFDLVQSSLDPADAAMVVSKVKIEITKLKFGSRSYTDREKIEEILNEMNQLIRELGAITLKEQWKENVHYIPNQIFVLDTLTDNVDIGKDFEIEYGNFALYKHDAPRPNFVILPAQEGDTVKMAAEQLKDKLQRDAIQIQASLREDDKAMYAGVRLSYIFYGQDEPVKDESDKDESGKNEPVENKPSKNETLLVKTLAQRHVEGLFSEALADLRKEPGIDVNAVDFLDHTAQDMFDRNWPILAQQYLPLILNVIKNSANKDEYIKNKALIYELFRIINRIRVMETGNHQAHIGLFFQNPLLSILKIPESTQKPRKPLQPLQYYYEEVKKEGLAYAHSKIEGHDEKVQILAGLFLQDPYGEKAIVIKLSRKEPRKIEDDAFQKVLMQKLDIELRNRIQGYLTKMGEPSVTFEELMGHFRMEGPMREKETYMWNISSVFTIGELVKGNLYVWKFRGSKVISMLSKKDATPSEDTVKTDPSRRRLLVGTGTILAGAMWWLRDKIREQEKEDLKHLIIGDPAQMTSELTKGGIDLNAANLNLHIKRDGNGVPLPVSQQDVANIHLDGLVPVILDIVPARASSVLAQLAA